MVPDPGSWNYSFMGMKYSATMRYDVRLGTPHEFYHQSHRHTHFMEFATLEAADVDADREDHFT